MQPLQLTQGSAQPPDVDNHDHSDYDLHRREPNPESPLPPTPHRHDPSLLRVALAFAAIYFVWGSTYLAIRIAIETLPPFLMAGTRFLIAGGILYAWARSHGAERPQPRHWATTSLIGGLMLLGGNGGVVWSEQRVPSGLTALLVATVPLWMVLLDWARRGGVRPNRLVFVGLALGLVGIGVLVGPDRLANSRRVDPLGAIVLVFAALSWAVGSLYARHAKLPESVRLATAMEMLTGGALLMLLGLASGQGAVVSLHHVSTRSLLALLYLICFGSLIGFSAYVWLLGVTSPARVATYAYVNPIVAMLTGWAFGNEPLTLRSLIAAAVIISGVVAITSAARAPVPRSPPDTPPPPPATPSQPVSARQE